MPPETQPRNAKKKKPRAAGKSPTGARRAAPVKARTTVVIVGSGRLGTALAVALEGAGYEVTALVARRRASAFRAARPLRSHPAALGADSLSKIPDSDLLFITTPDDEIARTAARLADALPESLTRPRRAPRVALHASGALSSGELAPLWALGFATGSLHPLVSVADPAANAKDLRGAYYCVEGDAPAAAAARRIVRALGGRAFTVAPPDKSLYHAAAAVASGHAVALFDLATELLARCGLTTAEARRVLLTLARTTLDNLAAAGANADALTGPIARADLSTVRAHLAALAASGAPDAVAIYALLGARALELAPTPTAPRLLALRELLRAAAAGHCPAARGNRR